MRAEDTLVSDLVLKEISDYIMKVVPSHIIAGWRIVRPGKPQLGSSGSVTYSYDNGGIIITSDKYVLTTMIDREASTIVHHLLYQPTGSIESAEVHSRVYSLSDPIAIEKACGFIIKVISEYISPFKKI